MKGPITLFSNSSVALVLEPHGNARYLKLYTPNYVRVLGFSYSRHGRID